jgi:hypothetical protein
MALFSECMLGVLESTLHGPTLLEKRCYTNHDLGHCNSTAFIDLPVSQT